MNRPFKSLKKETHKERDKPRIVLYNESEEKSYERYKHLQYRNLILKSLLTFLLGLILYGLFELK